MEKLFSILADILLLGAFVSIALLLIPETKFGVETPITYAVLATAVRLAKMDKYRTR